MQNFSRLRIWLIKAYNKIVHSIAFYPACIALLFLGLSILAINFDFSETGRQFKSRLHWLSLKDASTARSIIAVVGGGIISLTVFSFSMVMIMLNQAASQMTNRLLDKLIGNRSQQIVLGTYIGTIVFALFLLSTIRDVDSGIAIPALSTYLLILIAVIDIFLFIYFLHYITQSVKYEVIIQRIFNETLAGMRRTCTLDKSDAIDKSLDHPVEILSSTSGIYQGFDRKALLSICVSHHFSMTIMPYPGTFLLKGLPVIRTSMPLPDPVKESVLNTIYINNIDEIIKDSLYGFRQLTEIAVKSLSPGINDPGTAILCLRAIIKLLSYRIDHFPVTAVTDKEGEPRICSREMPFDKMFDDILLPIWDYGKNDRMIIRELEHLLLQLISLHASNAASHLLRLVQSAKNNIF